MLIPKVLLVILSVGCALAADEPSGEAVGLPFDFFMSPNHQELARERPLPFNPDEGHAFRREYEDKYGYRGERLIAMLGGGAAPLAIYDASFLGKTTTTSTTAAPGSVAEETVVDENVVLPVNATKTEENLQEDERTNQVTPRKYVEIDRKHNGFLTEQFFENNIPKDQSYGLSPDGIIYNRLYGAIWNYNTKGLPTNNGYEGGFKPLSGFLPPTWSGFDLSKQLPLTPLSQYNGQLNIVQPDLPSNPVIHEESQPSRQEYAGFGEPSIMVQSYSY